jgi:hypothetical protein
MMAPLTVPPQDRPDLERLVTFLERVQVHSGEQAAARAALMEKLRRYEDPRRPTGGAQRAA